MSSTPMFIQNLRPTEILIILLIILLLFGAKKLPDLARGVGKSLRIFRAETRALNDDDTEGGSGDEQTDARKAEARQIEQNPTGPVHDPRSDEVADQLKRDA